MKHLLTALGSFSIPFLFVSCVAHQTCSNKERIEMKESGFSIDEITNVCTSYKIPDEAFKVMEQVLQTELEKNLQDGKRSTPAAAQDSYQPPSYRVVQGQAATCATQVGVCPLMQPGYSGAPCVCHTLYGQIPGVMR